MAGRRRSTRRRRREPIRQQNTSVQAGVAAEAGAKALHVADAAVPGAAPGPQRLLDFASLRRDLVTSLLLGLVMAGAVITVALMIE